MKIKLGVRGSKLALAYADIVKRKINSVGDYDVEVVVIKTDGDIFRGIYRH